MVIIGLSGTSAGWAQTARQGTWQAPSQGAAQGSWQAPSDGTAQGTGQASSQSDTRGSWQSASRGDAQGTRQGGSQGSTSGIMYGVFRENNTEIASGQRNCWAQAMVSGSTINGELLAERLTEKQAETTLQRYASLGRCANQVVAPKWTMRQD